MTVITRNVKVNAETVTIEARNPSVAASPRCCHTGGNPAMASTDGNNSTPSVTETYFAEIYVPETMTVTGIALFNGDAAAGNVTTAIYRSTGSLVAGSTSASTAQAGTDAYQAFDCTSAVTLHEGTYYVAAQFSNTSARFNTHALGAFGAGKKTATVYGTMPSGVVVPTTFTTALGPIASFY